jgi:hypothetical protein
MKIILLIYLLGALKSADNTIEIKIQDPLIPIQKEIQITKEEEKKIFKLIFDPATIFDSENKILSLKIEGPKDLLKLRIYQTDESGNWARFSS